MSIAVKPLRRLTRLVCCFLICAYGTVLGQNRSLPYADSFSRLQTNARSGQLLRPDSGTAGERQLARAEACLISFKNDSAIALTSQLLNRLKTSGQMNTPFGLRTQLVQATAFEQDQQSSVAMQKLLRVSELSQQSKQWNTHVRASLVMALLYEKVGRSASSRQELARAKAEIDQYGLRSLYPYYAIRMASWERQFGDRGRALFFAREALAAAPQHGLVLEEAISHMLLNLLLPPAATAARMAHCLRAAQLYQQLDDYTGRGMMFHAIARIYYQGQQFRQALTYMDSTILMANQATAEGIERNEGIGNYYRLRGEIYEQLGQLDSALVNTKKGYQLELALMEKDVRDKVIAVDARYQNKLKQEQIDEQQRALRLKNNQLRLSAVIVVLILLLAGGLWLSYRRQREARQMLIERNALILRQTDQLKSLDAAKSRFFANVSHELRTPLSLITGPISTLLTESQQHPRQTALLNMVRYSARQLELMVNDILDLRKMEVGEMITYPEPTQLFSFFQLHINQFESLASYRQIQYQHAISIDASLVVDLDREKCRQILYNLLSNAFKFTPAGGQVRVAVRLQAGQLGIEVADTGAGIHPDDVALVFRPFFQTSRAGHPPTGGTGIGLTICHEYVQLMQGTISVESQPGEGSLFHASWPVTPSGQEAAPVAPLLVNELRELYGVGVSGAMNAPAGAAAGVSVSAPTILIVEDNPGLRDYIGLLLEERYRIVSAGNGAEALQCIATADQPVDLILSDLMMPVMDGYTLLERLKASDTTRHIPVIMLTARAEPADRLHALRIGVDDYLTKPFDENELLVRIANLLANQSVRRQEALTTPADTEPEPGSATDHVWLETFEAYISNNLNSSVLTIPSLSDAFAMSESTLLRQVRRLTGLTPVQYLQEIRLTKARLLLEHDPHLPVATVAAQVGYRDARSFSRIFKSRFGKSPSSLLEV